MRRVALVLALLLGLASSALADGVSCSPCTITWDFPTANSDGSALTGLASFNIYLAPLPGGPYALVGNVSVPSALAVSASFVVKGLADQQYVVIGAVNTAGREGPRSAPTPFVYAVVPGPVTNVRVK